MGASHMIFMGSLVFVRPVLNNLAQRLGIAGHSVTKVYLFCDVDADKHWSDTRVALEFKGTNSAWFRKGKYSIGLLPDVNHRYKKYNLCLNEGVPSTSVVLSLCS